MPWKLGFLALITGAIVSVVLSTNIVVVRRFNPNTTHPHFADLFSNQQCSSSACAADRSTCAGGSCCMCQCLYDYPNVFMNGTSLKCTNYAEINRMSSANCRYSFRKPNEPLEVIPLTEDASGKIRFKNDSARVNCSENGLAVDAWQYLDVDGRLKNGQGNVFHVDFRTVGGRDGNKKDLTFLNWNATLDAKYAGLIIKLSLSCGGRNVGCILAKINGTYTYNTLQSTASAPPSTTTAQQPSTDPTPAPVQEETTTLPSPSTAGEPETSEPPTPGLPSGTTPGPSPSQATQGSPVRQSVPASNGIHSSSTTKAPTLSAEKQQASDANNNGSSSKVVWPVVGTIGGLIALICLVCLIVALYKRRKRMFSEKPAKDPEIDSEAKLNDNDYQDPVYAELPDNTQTEGDFDNPIYCDPTEEQIMRRSKQDPLPAVPAGDESTYQPLDQNTRTVPGPRAPTPPPVSSDYLNPEREEPDAVDYDNPPATNHVSMNNESSDYDNPPIQGNTSPPMSTHRNENLNNDSSDYDNPPLQGNTSPPMSTQRNENLNNESSEYDNPPVQNISRSQGATSESVPESTQDAITEPEYLELEPPEDSHF